MNTISYSAVRKNLARVMEQVCDDYAPVAVTRQNAQSVVMMSLAEYESLAETLYLLRSPKNAARLAHSIAEIEAGKAKKRKLIEKELINWNCTLAKRLEDYLYWQQNDAKLLARINELIRETQRQPFSGIGKPEPLKFDLKGYWSRRINGEHRLVYKVEQKAVYIAQCRHHY